MHLVNVLGTHVKKNNCSDEASAMLFDGAEKHLVEPGLVQKAV